MKRSTRFALVLALLLGSGLGLRFWLHSRTPAKQGGSVETSAPGTRAGASPQPLRLRPGGGFAAGGHDPEGALRLEGQVVDAADKPVEGATVTIDTNPVRQAASDAGGSFVFDKLLGRPYLVAARAGSRVAGPLRVRLTGKSEPVTLRLRAGASVEVTVVTQADKRPVQGATVELQGMQILGGTTSADGRVRIEGVAPGEAWLAASAPGFARTLLPLEIPGRFSPVGVLLRMQLELSRGAAVSGRVVTPDGKPIAAQVRALNAADSMLSPFRLPDSVQTDGEGVFRFDALPVGTFHFAAVHEAYDRGLSEAVTVDGASERRGVEIRLQAGATIEGRVISRDGRPVAGATVFVSGRRGMGLGPNSRQQTTSADDGAFRLIGLPRAALTLGAVAEAAASENVDVDLTGQTEKHDVVISLGQDGTIAGTVTDSRGRPVPEASVFALPRRRRDASARDVTARAAGPVTDTTDMGGQFMLRGLAPGSYVLAASRSPGRPGRGERQGRVEAETGSRDVRLVLDDGGIRGRVTFADGRAPSFFLIHLGGSREGIPFGTADGSFRLEEVPSGPVTVLASGPDFEPARAATTVAAGQIADVGTLTVSPAGRLSGRVLLRSGQPVAGADVYGGASLVGNGLQPVSSASGASLAPYGSSELAAPPVHTTADERGQFSIAVPGSGELLLVADHTKYGRSRAVTVPAGGQPSGPLELFLEPFASVDGIVTRGGKPAASVLVTARGQSAPDATLSVRSGPDGLFRFDRLAADTYRLSAVEQGSRRGVGSTSTTVTLPGGQYPNRVALAIDAGNVTLVLTPQSADGRTAQARVYVVPGAIAPPTARALHATAATTSGSYSFSGLAVSGRPVRATNVPSGDYSACAVPVPASIRGGDVAGYITAHADTLRAFCVPQSVAESPPEQVIPIPVVVPTGP